MPGYRLLRSLLAVEAQPNNRRLVSIPANSILQRIDARTFAPGFAMVAWQGRSFLVFEEDLREQRQLRPRIVRSACGRRE